MGRRKLKEAVEAACTSEMEKKKKKKRVREDDGFSFLCSVCDDFGELICCERCRDSFHLSCLGLDGCPDADPWLCPSCSDNKVSTFTAVTYSHHFSLDELRKDYG